MPCYGLAGKITAEQSIDGFGLIHAWRIKSPTKNPFFAISFFQCRFCRYIRVSGQAMLTVNFYKPNTTAC